MLRQEAEYTFYAGNGLTEKVWQGKKQRMFPGKIQPGKQSRHRLKVKTKKIKRKEAVAEKVWK